MYLLACCLIALRCALCLTDRGTEEAAARRLSLLGGCRCPARIEGALQPQTGDTGEIRHRTLLIDHRSLQYHVATRRCTTEHFSAPAILYITIWAAATVVRFFLIDFSKRSSGSNLKRAFLRYYAQYCLRLGSSSSYSTDWLSLVHFHVLCTCCLAHRAASRSLAPYSLHYACYVTAPLH